MNHLFPGFCNWLGQYMLVKNKMPPSNFVNTEKLIITEVAVTTNDQSENNVLLILAMFT